MPSFSVTAKEDEMRAVWFSYEDYRNELSSLSRADFEEKAKGICKNITEYGINTIIFHVRAFSDAFYNSSYFPYSRYVCGETGVQPDYDPLSIMCDVAHKNGVSIHAWVNPYRIGAPSNVTESSIPFLWKNEFGSERVCELDGKWYYNPASSQVRQYIIDGVAEIVKNYSVDGIHFDDYFYPTADESFDTESYLNSKTSLSLSEWRIENVNALISETYKTIKEIDPDVVFGISPSADIEKNYSSLFADVKKWGTEKGYVDYLTPQIYFGYENSILPFDKVLNDWYDICKNITLYVGLAPYKAGKEDKWAGDGKYEWIENSNICARQIQDLRKKQSCGGFMLFNYSAMFSEYATQNAKAELEAIKNLVFTPSDMSPMKAFVAMIKAIFNIFD